MPPSHFASSAQFAGQNRVVTTSGTTPPLHWVSQGLSSRDPSSPNPWLAISQAQQEIMELRKENQRIKILYQDSVHGSSPKDAKSAFRPRYVTLLFLSEKCSMDAILAVQVVPFSQKQMERER